MATRRRSPVSHPHARLPIIIQIVDSEENIRRLLPVVEDMMDKGLIAMSDVKISEFRRRRRFRMFEKILVAHDGSDGAQKAFDVAVELASGSRWASYDQRGGGLPRYAETTMGRSTR